MLLDRAFRATVRNFSTLFLLVAIVTVPLHVAHAYVFRRVIAVSELHPAIERFPRARKVSGVGRAELTEARTSYLVLNLFEVALLPLVARAAARAMAADRSGGVPTVMRALAPRGHSTRAVSWRLVSPGTLAVALAVAVVVTWLARAAGLILVEPLPSTSSWAGVGVVEGLCRAVGAPFFVGPAGWMATKDAGRARPDRKKDAGRARPDRKKDAGRARPDRKKDT
jgi:hypothetical protein